MNDNSQAIEFDPEEAGRLHAQELISALATKYRTTEAFSEALALVRRVLLETLDAVDPEQMVEATRRNVLPDAVRGRLADESEQRRKDRGSLQDPLYPPAQPKHWD